MTPAAAKLLMCICAGSSGAIMVPAVERARTAIKARPAGDRPVQRPRVRRAAAAGVAAPVAACPPAAAAAVAAGGGPVGTPAESLVAAAIDAAGFTVPRGAVGGGGSSGEPGGFGVGAAVPQMPRAGGTLLELPPSAAPLPVNSPTPEPGSWLMMIAGFGAVGAALRRVRRLQVEAGAGTD